MLAVVAAMAVAAPAHADDETVPVQSTAETELTCQDPEVAPLLSEFNDDDLYFLAPGGDFEHGTDGWTLEGGATIAGGSSVFSPFGSGDHSLQLPVGSAATSPAFCVDERYPRFRMSVGQLGAKKAEVQVSVVYPGLRDNVRKAGDVTADEKQRWRLSNKLNLDPQRGLKRKAWPCASKSSRATPPATHGSTTCSSTQRCATRPEDGPAGSRGGRAPRRRSGPRTARPRAPGGWRGRASRARRPPA